MTRLLKLITFDVTGTLVHFRPPVAVKYAETAKRFGINIKSEDVMPHFKVHWKALSASDPNFGRDSGLGWEAWWTKVVVGTFKSAVPNCEEDNLEKLAACLIEEYKEHHCFALANGALEILDFLKSKNIHLGVISNYDERLEGILTALGIHSYFNFILTSYSAGVMKPDQKIFNLARTLANDNIQPCHCVHIGNSFKLDYLGAKNAGWKSVYLGPVDESVGEVANSEDVIQDLVELQHYFKSDLKL